MWQTVSEVANWLGGLVGVFPWIVVLVVYIGEYLKQRTLTKILKDALESAQNAAHGAIPPVIAPPSAPPVPTPAPTPVPPTAPVVPVPSGPFADAPPWFQAALHEIGFHETGNNGGIQRYVNLAHCGAEGDPWCAIFTNAMLESSGVPGTRSPSSQSFRSNPNFVPLAQPALGAITVYWRGSQASGLGHVGFYRGEDSSRVWTLGGNENDMVQIEALPKNASSFGLIGYWWPKGVPLPTGGPVMMPAGSPVHVQTDPSGASVPAAASRDGVYTNITATMFGGQQSAYGGPIDDNAYGVALTYHFAGARPQVEVTNPKTGTAITCNICDVGPWNTNDPYWQTGSRPQSETGTDMTGRHTNKAGIDLTYAAASALQIDGKGLVNWKFATDSLVNPKVT